MQPYQYAFEAIGTQWVIDLYDLPASISAQELLSDLQQRISTFDKNYSRFRSDSLVTKMSVEAETYVLPDDAPPLLDIYRQLYDLTGGRFTPLIGRTLEEAGYDAQYSLRPKKLHRPPTWEEVIDWQPPQLNLKQPALLDFGAAGKGYLIDIVGQLLRDHGVEAFCIDAGGDILYSQPTGDKLRVGLEHPGNTDQIIGVAQLESGKSICASAGNRRKWGPFHHIIDATTLRSPANVLATWVMADSALLADGLATALFFVPGKTLKEVFDFEYLIVDDGYSFVKSEHFNSELFSLSILSK